MEHSYEHHQATDSLVNLFTKANHDLTVVQHRLEKEFQQVYPDNANPMKLVSRIKKIQEDLLTLKEQCHELLAAKQDLIDKAQTTLVGNRSLLQRMQASVGIPLTSDSDDPAYANFNQEDKLKLITFWSSNLQVVDEWAVQVRSRTGDEQHKSDSKDINKLLFSAIVQTN
ncbi:spindle and kinetochore-associated protein 2 isoform X1 [Carya illinoinensis]|uniref:spindle and kinetochore-associated protein 2 isoform X1 n=1 Tax=Carya illinoinensis TaxID=32201 RepID=UPI001C71C280|nr:spindle and kinetochore-associated protein 2 isoform X1 [Carya illinoinensis]